MAKIVTGCLRFGLYGMLIMNQDLHPFWMQIPNYYFQWVYTSKSQNIVTVLNFVFSSTDIIPISKEYNIIP